MKNINEINSENFHDMFDINYLIKESVFYPSSGIDATDIECLSKEFFSFIHVDYSEMKDAVKYAMCNHFYGIGYDLIGIREVSHDELCANGFKSINFDLTKDEDARLDAFDFIKNRFLYDNFQQFAFWSVYELNPHRNMGSKDKPKRFSLLHIGGEACEAFEKVYYSNKVNPCVIVLKNTGECYGDNWTNFLDPDGRLHKYITNNHFVNNANMPAVIISNMASRDEQEFFWPNYLFSKKVFADGWLRFYARKAD